MKKTTTLIITLLCYFVNAQNSSSNVKINKFQFGVSYALTSDEIRYKNPFIASLNYQVKQWGAVGLGIGVQAYMFSPESEYSKNLSTRWGFNPNISSSYSFFNNKLKTYAAFGYYFDEYELTTSELYLVSPSKKYDVKSTGFTVIPGIKYFVHSNIFFDINYTLLKSKTKEIWEGSSYSFSDNLFNIGVGASF